MIRKINFYDYDFDLIKSVDITHPVPPCWEPSGDLDAAVAIQAVVGETLIGLASKVGVTWSYNLVGGPGHLPPVGASQRDSLREIVTFFSEAMLLSERQN